MTKTVEVETKYLKSLIKDKNIIDLKSGKSKILHGLWHRNKGDKISFFVSNLFSLVFYYGQYHIFIHLSFTPTGKEKKENNVVCVEVNDFEYAKKWAKDMFNINLSEEDINTL